MDELTAVRGLALLLGLGLVALIAAMVVAARRRASKRSPADHAVAKGRPSTVNPPAREKTTSHNPPGPWSGQQF